MYESIKWNELFLTEKDLLTALEKWDYNTRKGKLTKGYEYLQSFQSYYLKKGDLTEKQMIQLKRLARALYSYYTNDYALLNTKALAF